jgi:hypothetical protein
MSRRAGGAGAAGDSSSGEGRFGVEWKTCAFMYYYFSEDCDPNTVIQIHIPCGQRIEGR